MRICVMYVVRPYVLCTNGSSAGKHDVARISESITRDTEIAAIVGGIFATVNPQHAVRFCMFCPSVRTDLFFFRRAFDHVRVLLARAKWCA